jgi:alpha-L-fucosidase
MNYRQMLLRAIIIVASWSTSLVAQELPDNWRNPIVKRGYLNSPLVEVTPLSFKGELFLMECWRSKWEWDGGPSPSVKKQSEIWMARLSAGPEHYDNRKYVGRVLENCTLGTAIIWDDRVYVYAVNAEHSTGGNVVYMTWTEDMKTWSEPIKVFKSPAKNIFNVAVTRDERGMVFLWETNGYGQPFTMCYGRVKKPIESWQDCIIEKARYGMNKYTGGPSLYYYDRWYYTLYLEALGGGKYETHITRSRNLVDWQDAPQDRPFLTFDPLKKNLPLRPPEATEKNASDAELCFHDGRTLIYFTGADQIRGGDLQWATYAGTPASLFDSFFAGKQEK